MFKFPPPRHDPRVFSDTDDLGRVGGLIQSLRWFSGRTSMLLYYWGMHEVLEKEARAPRSPIPMSSDAQFMIRRAFLHNVILEARAIHDRDKRSLGSSQIASRLEDPEARAGLNKHLLDYPRSRVMQDVDLRDRYLDYIQRYCCVMSAPRAEMNAHPLSAKVELVRRISNKSVAHSTLDEFMLGWEDLGDVVIATVGIACAIEAALGNAAVNNDFAEVESAGYVAGGRLLQVAADSGPYLVNAIRALLPAWVKFGIEFPDHPNDLSRDSGQAQ